MLDEMLAALVEYAAESDDALLEASDSPARSTTRRRRSSRTSTTTRGDDDFDASAGNDADARTSTSADAPDDSDDPSNPSRPTSFRCVPHPTAPSPPNNGLAPARIER